MRSGIFHFVVNGDYTPTTKNVYIPIGVLNNGDVIGLTLEHQIVQVNKNNENVKTEEAPNNFIKIYSKELANAKTTFEYASYQLCLYFMGEPKIYTDEELFEML